MKSTAILLLSAAFSLAAHAEVTIHDAWVRGTVPAQKATGAFMTLKSSEDATLLSVASPAAKMVEIHEMKMERDVMKMRAVDKLALPAGKAVALKPGGYHIMLMDLAEPLKKGAKVPLTLKVQGKDGKVQDIALQAEVRDLAGGDKEHKH